LAKIIDGRLQLAPSVSSLFPKNHTSVVKDSTITPEAPVFLYSKLWIGQAAFSAIAYRVHWPDEATLAAYDTAYDEAVEQLIESVGITPTPQKIKGHPGEWLVVIEPC
jgi:hypothetical protein